MSLNGEEERYNAGRPHKAEGAVSGQSAAWDALLSVEVFKKLVDALPYTVWINAPDGKTLYLNEAGIKQRRHSKEFLKSFNLLDDPNVAAMVPIERLKRVLGGETVFFGCVRVPLETLIKIQGVKPDLEALYEDITVFPVTEEGRVKYIVTLQVPCRAYKGKPEIERAKEYIDNNWLENFDAVGTLKASGLSKAYFFRLFKKCTGMTPHEYYTSVKIGKLKEKLLDPRISVTRAFADCGLDYSGHAAKIFKDKVGFSPAEFKERAKTNKVE